jgi:hypothetical protein
MRKKMTRELGLGFLLGIGGLLGGGALAAGLASCDTADEAFDCQAVCSKYQECIDHSYDVGACRSRCRDKAAADSDYKRKADTCHACISDRSCSDSTFKCATECLGIVP